MSAVHSPSRSAKEPALYHRSSVRSQGMSKNLQLTAKDSSLKNPRGAVGLLCEFAPDSPWLREAECWYGPDRLLGSADEALKSVYPLVTKLLQAAPQVEGVALVKIFEETLLEQFSYIAQALQLDRWICEEGFTRCHFGAYSAWLDRLREVKRFTGSPYQLTADMSTLQSNAQTRALQRLWASRPALPEFFRRVMPLRSRWLSGLPMHAAAKRAPRGGIWFYSTAYNYTKIGLEYEPYLPEKMNYLVEDPATGGKRLRELGRDWQLLYGWAERSDIPSSSEVSTLGKQIASAISAVPLSETENLLRAVFLKSEWWQLFLSRWLAFLIFNSRVLQRWYRSVAPEMILVGNAGFERALLLHERVREVPVVMLQHGIMHWVFGVTDEPVDVFLLRGSFFQRSVNENFRRKTLILNHSAAPSHPIAPKRDGVGDSILFITAPYDIPELFHREDLRDILRSLMRASRATGRCLVIRVHPMEKISTYQRLVAGLVSDLGFGVDVQYSQGPGIQEILARSSVAVLYFSTMFLDCLRYGIPIISFGWHWFPNRRQFEEEGIFNFASDLKNFEELIAQGVAGKLNVRRMGIEEFLAPVQSERISNFFRDIWESGRVAASEISNARFSA